MSYRCFVFFLFFICISRLQFSFTSLSLKEKVMNYERIYLQHLHRQRTIFFILIMTPNHTHTQLSFRAWTRQNWKSGKLTVVVFVFVSFVCFAIELRLSHFHRDACIYADWNKLNVFSFSLHSIEKRKKQTMGGRKTEQIQMTRSERETIGEENSTTLD